MAQVNAALAEDLQGVGGAFMGLGTCQDKGRIFPKVGFAPCSPDIVPSRSPGWVNPTEGLCFQTMPG